MRGAGGQPVVVEVDGVVVDVDGVVVELEPELDEDPELDPMCLQAPLGIAPLGGAEDEPLLLGGPVGAVGGVVLVPDDALDPDDPLDPDEFEEVPLDVLEVLAVFVALVPVEDPVAAWAATAPPTRRPVDRAPMPITSRTRNFMVDTYLSQLASDLARISCRGTTNRAGAAWEAAVGERSAA